MIYLPASAGAVLSSQPIRRRELVVNQPQRRYSMDPELVRRVYTADGTDGQVALEVSLGSRLVAFIRDGVLYPELTLGLVPGIRPRRDRPDAVMSYEEMHKRLAIASCLKAKHRGGCILEDPAIDELLPV